MDKLFRLTLMLIMCISAGVFTSCEDDDTESSIYLSGQWQGDWGMYYDYYYRGQTYRFNSYDTDVVFYPDYDYATHGYGYQVDWYNEGPYERMSFKFYWEIKNGVIYLDYPGYPEYDAQIYDYYLSNSRFTGRFELESDKFSLYKISDYYDWSYYYDWDYHYWDNDGWYWSTYSARSEDSVGADEGTIVKIGSRFSSSK